MTARSIHGDILRAIAEAAADVPLAAVGALDHFRGTVSPREVLALLDESRDLQSSLREALDGWDAAKGGEPDARSRELRARLMGGGK